VTACNYTWILFPFFNTGVLSAHVHLRNKAWIQANDTHFAGSCEEAYWIHAWLCGRLKNTINIQYNLYTNELKAYITHRTFLNVTVK